MSTQPKMRTPRPTHDLVSRLGQGFLLLALLVPGAAMAAPHTTGGWSLPFNLFPAMTSGPYSTTSPHDISVHTALLHNSGSTATLIHWADSFTIRSWVYDPAARDASIFDNSAPLSISTTTMPITTCAQVFCSGETVIEDGRLLVFGGTSAAGRQDRDPNYCTNNLSKTSYWTGPVKAYAFDPTTASTSAPYGWSELADFTEGRWYPTATTLGNGKVLISGGVRGNVYPVIGGETGTSTNFIPTQDLRVFEDLITQRVTDSVTVNLSTGPTGRADYGAAFDGDRKGAERELVFGGHTSSGLSNELWQLRRLESPDDYGTPDEKWQWSQIPFTGGPSARAYMDAVYEPIHDGSDYGSLLVFGGMGAGSPAALGDVWRFQFYERDRNNPNCLNASACNSGMWVNVTPPGNAPLQVPEPRYGHSSLRVPDLDQPAGTPDSAGYVITLFGYDDATSQYVNDGPNVWRLRIHDSQWVREDVDGDITYGYPSQREGASVAFDDNQNTDPNYGFAAIVFGGRNGSTYYNDTWRLNLVRNHAGHWQWKKLGPECDSGTGDCLSASTYPAARARASMALDTFDKSRITLFGGENAGGKLNDLWQLPVNYSNIHMETAARDQWLPIGVSTEARAGHKIVFDASGYNARHLELYNPITGTWAKYLSAPQILNSYPQVFQQPADGKLFFANTGTHSRIFDASLGAWAATLPGSYWGNLTYPTSPVVNMFRPGQLMRCGGYEQLTTTQTINLTGPYPDWDWRSNSTWDLPSGQGRFHQNLVSLPDGSVLMVGGTNGGSGVGQDTANARRTPYLWTPDPDPTYTQGTWTEMAKEPMPRGYHSTAVLLPDGRVLASGGSDVDSKSGIDPGASTAEIYSPPYLYDSSNDQPIYLSSRPQITSAPSTFTYDPSQSTFTVNVMLYQNHTISKVCLIRAGAVTHSDAMDQRYIPLDFSQTSSTTLTVEKRTTVYGGLQHDESADTRYTFADATKGPWLAPPGWYMLFVVDDRGVPSVAKWVKIDNVAPNAVADLQCSSICASMVTLNFTAPGDDAGIGTATSYEVWSFASLSDAQNWNTASGTHVTTGVSSPQHAGTQQALSVPAPAYPTTRYYALKTHDAAGNVSAVSNVVSGQADNLPAHQCEDQGRGITPPSEPEMPTAVELAAPKPNPTEKSIATQLRFGVPVNRAGEKYELAIFDLVGRKIVTVDQGVSVPGYHVVEWNLGSKSGERVGRGVYFVRLRMGSTTLTQRVIVVH